MSYSDDKKTTSDSVRGGSFSLIFFLLLGAIVLAGCAGYKARTNELLAQNYQEMTNEELTLYYYELEDQIMVVESNSSNPRVSLGFGFGNYGRHSGVSTGVGISSDVPQNSPTSDLRERRNRVRLELQRRGISVN